MNLKIIEDTVMASVEAKAAMRKSINRRENKVMTLFCAVVVIVLSLSVYMLRGDKIQVLLSSFHPGIGADEVIQNGTYNLLIGTAIGLAVISFIGYAIVMKQQVLRKV